MMRLQFQLLNVGKLKKCVWFEWQDVVLPALVRREESSESCKIATKKFVKLTCTKDQLALSLKV
jgi:hypothetical protein